MFPHVHHGVFIKKAIPKGSLCSWEGSSKLTEYFPRLIAHQCSHQCFWLIDRFLLSDRYWSWTFGPDDSDLSQLQTFGSCTLHASQATWNKLLLLDVLSPPCSYHIPSPWRTRTLLLTWDGNSHRQYPSWQKCNRHTQNVLWFGFITITIPSSYMFIHDIKCTCIYFLAYNDRFQYVHSWWISLVFGILATFSSNKTLIIKHGKCRLAG